MQDADMTVFGMLRNLFRGPFDHEPARRLYRTIVEQSRDPLFYTAYGVRDTADGRFDMIALHAFLVMRRLRSGDSRCAEVSQALFDLMFADMDQNLREMGIGDTGIAKRIKALAANFYGRVAAYDAALAAGDREALSAALRRNLYRNHDPDPGDVDAMATYVFGEARALENQDATELTAGTVRFGRPDERSRGPS